MSESNVINERFDSSPRRSCLDTAWSPTVFNYTNGAERLNPETVEYYEHMKTVVKRPVFRKKWSLTSVAPKWGALDQGRLGLS